MSREGHQSGATSRTSGASRGEFHNPYNFVPTPPRKITGELADMGALPEKPEHGAFQENRFSGTIRLKVTTTTPLMLPETGSGKDKRPNGHTIFPVRINSQGHPSIHPASIKGMIRSAFEAITNSRYSVFNQWDNCLFFRNDSTEPLVPVIISEISENHIKLKTLEKTWTMRKKDGYGFKVIRPKAPARLLRYPKPQNNGSNPRITDGNNKPTTYEGTGDLPQNGDHVLVQVGEDGRVHKIRKFDGPPTKDWHEGWVLVTNQNFPSKIYERVFVLSPGKDGERVLRNDEAQRIKKQWRDLINNYQDIHQKEAGQTNKPGNGAPGKEKTLELSSHITDKSRNDLRPDACVYAKIQKDGKIKGLYPVSKSRLMYESSPFDVLHPSLRPALCLDELSPADRVFGWVSSGKMSASSHTESKANPMATSTESGWKGCFRIKTVGCRTANAIETFGQPTGLPLNILGQPKPQQARFYCANNQEGDPLPDKCDIETSGFSTEKGLRGRKVYPHHNGLPAGHWNPDNTSQNNKNSNGHFQEYRRPGGTQDKQNRSIRGWVKPGVEFQVEIGIQNLSAVELGGLLWLFSLPDGHFLRLGGAKPFGLGSVKLDWVPEHSNIGDGRDWARYYSLESALPSLDPAFCIKEFKKAVANAYGKPFEETSSDKSFMEVSFIKAFLTACSGYKNKLPVHYPRVRPAHGSNGPVPPHPEGKSYEWFVENNKVRLNGCALPSLAEGQGLPYLQKQPSKRSS